jgi:putative hemolysin
MTSEVLDIEIQNVTLTNVDTQYSITPPAGAKYFSLQARDDNPFRWSNVTGKVATPTDPYMTCKADSYFNAPEKFCCKAGMILYFGTDTAGQVIEVCFFKNG